MSSFSFTFIKDTITCLWFFEEETLLIPVELRFIVCLAERAFLRG